MDKREQAILYLKELSKCKPSHVFDRFNNMEKGIQFILLYLYEHNNEIIAGDLALNLKVSTARIAVLLKKMERKDLIVKRSSAQDGRKTVVELTSIGKKNVEAMRKKALEKMESLIEEIGEDDIRDFIRISLKIKEFMEREETTNV